jgi:hypothetical protein
MEILRHNVHRTLKAFFILKAFSNRFQVPIVCFRSSRELTGLKVQNCPLRRGEFERREFFELPGQERRRSISQ